MRSLVFVLVLAAALAVLIGCQQHRKDMPVPAPQSAHAADARHDAPPPVLETIFSRSTSAAPFSQHGCPHARLLRF
jgi:uncharacterized lipoprotein YbaY